MSIVKLNNNAIKNVTAFGSLTSGSMTFIKKLTASSSSTLSFVDGSSSVVLDNTYKEYLFTFKNIHAATDNSEFSYAFSSNAGSSYTSVQKQTTYFRSYHYEDGSSGAGQEYRTGQDTALGTGKRPLSEGQGNANDESLSGFFHLFDPSNTSHVKHFIAVTNFSGRLDYTMDCYTTGYANTTSAIDAVQFSMDTGNIDAGDICLYGIN
jgi:hypothetical protein